MFKSRQLQFRWDASFGAFSIASKLDSERKLRRPNSLAIKLTMPRRGPCHLSTSGRRSCKPTRASAGQALFPFAQTTVVREYEFALISDSGNRYSGRPAIASARRIRGIFAAGGNYPGDCRHRAQIGETAMPDGFVAPRPIRCAIAPAGFGRLETPRFTKNCLSIRASWWKFISQYDIN